LLGWQWGRFFEKRSFIATEKIPNAHSLEKKLPCYCTAKPTAENLRLKRTFINQLAAFIRHFHQAGFCHRDLYFSHIFYSEPGQFHLIDLARVFKPAFFKHIFFKNRPIALLLCSCLPKKIDRNRQDSYTHNQKQGQTYGKARQKTRQDRTI